MTLEAGQAVSIIKGETVQFQCICYRADTCPWTSNPNDASLTSTTILNPSATPLVTTTYTITAVNNQGGCRATDESLSRLFHTVSKVNNAFTPNGDGINELWLVYDSYDCLKTFPLTYSTVMAAKCMKIKITAIIGTAAIKANPCRMPLTMPWSSLRLYRVRKWPLKPTWPFYVDRSHFYISNPPCFRGAFISKLCYMDIEQIRDYALSLEQVTEDSFWRNSPGI